MESVEHNCHRADQPRTSASNRQHNQSDSRIKKRQEVKGQEATAPSHPEKTDQKKTKKKATMS